MTLIKSISGMRGTIGGKPGDNLTPIDAVELAAAFGQWLKKRGLASRVVIGRDGRISGPMISALVSQTLCGMGIEVIDQGLSTTPTVAMGVPYHQAGGGIVLTASHNPEQWNALKLLNEKGEFISAEDGRELLELLGRRDFTFAEVHQLGKTLPDAEACDMHVRAILELEAVPVEAIRKRNFKVLVDAVNSTGALYMPPLLKQLGCEVGLLNGEVNGHFAHNPEPLPKHLTHLAKAVKEQKADLGIAVDPDVDRLVLVCEDGSMFGEEYTLVAVADYILSRTPGPVVSNLSSSRALRDLAERYGQAYHASAVGEVHVVKKMKETGAVIGGEGNGGIIYPQLHYGRDAMVGIALFLAQLLRSGQTASALRAGYPHYEMIKDKIPLQADMNPDALLEQLAQRFGAPDASGKMQNQINTVDGLKIERGKSWVHLRKSNTEPILRLYAEAPTAEEARSLAREVADAVAAWK